MIRGSGRNKGCSVHSRAFDLADITDAVVDKVVADARNYYPKVRAAAEGMEIKL